MADVQNLDAGVTEIFEGLSDIHRYKSEFTEKRKVFLWGAVDDDSSRDVVNRLLYLDAKKPGDEISFYINSPGGIVTSGMVIYDAMQMIQSPVRTICIGLAASMGSILLSGGAKGKREIWPHGRVMIHQPHIGGLMGTASDLQIQAREIVKTKELGARILAQNCDKSFDQVMDDFDRDLWMNAGESISYEIVDSVAKSTGF